MKYLLLLALAALLFVSVPTAAMPGSGVCGLKPFTAETNYLSLAGFTRWQLFQDELRWISRGEAVRLVAAETKYCRL